VILALVAGAVIAAAVGAGIAVVRAPDDGQRWNDFDSPPWTEGIEVGESYEYSVNPHCGIRNAQIDGTLWRADPPLVDENGNPPDWWSGSTVGELRIIDTNTAVFRNDDGHQAVFVRDNLRGRPCF
jgi:hypothetical protein